MNTIRLIIHSEFLPKKEMLVSKDDSFLNISKEIIGGLKRKENRFNQFISSFLSCFFTLDNSSKGLILTFEDYNTIDRKLTGTIGELSEHGVLNCFLKEANDDELLDYKSRINTELYGNTRFIDIPLDHSDEDGASDILTAKSKYLSDEYKTFKSSSLYRKNRFYNWSSNKKKVKSHYYSWD